MENNALQHYGILGMKWGVRRTESQLRGTKGSSLANEQKKKSQKKENPVKKMSDAELRQRINRIQMERQYAQLTAKQKSIGQKFVTDILTNAAKQTATTYVSRYMMKGADAIIKKTTGVE